VLNQTFKEFELIIVDDGSTDESVSQVMRISDNRIRLIQKQNGGVSSARNRGIREAKYSYIALLDADDYWMPDYLLEQKRLIEDFPEANMWGCAFGYLEKENFQQVEHGIPIGFRGVLKNYWSMYKKSNIFSSISVVIKKEGFNVAGFFDERLKYSEDLDMWYRIILNFQVVFYNNTLTYYRIDAENRAMDKEIPLDKFLPYYIEKYADYRKSNADFRRFIDRFCLEAVFPHFVNGTYGEDVKRILNQIDLSEQKWTYRFRFMFPHLFGFMVKHLL
jgi:glycosyltransferase involved in cell wall biosynthesis